MSKVPMVISKGGAVPAVVAAEGINSFGRILQAWIDWQQCRVALRGLEVEERRIEAEFMTASAEIESRTKIRLEELRNTRLQVEKQLDLMKKLMKQLSGDRSRILDLIDQAQRDGQYEFAALCIQMFREKREEQIDMLDRLVRPATNERKQIGE
ncbi:MAG: hypothetical protein JXR40_06305 [Pontiellaceae bacterium]|nr:hypothetical protein [Pontiellaceae bacterium]